MRSTSHSSGLLRGLCVPPLLALTLLAGCATPQDRAAQKQAEADQMMAVYGPACSRLGYAAGSDPWRNCVVNLSTKDEIQRYGSPGYPGYYPGRWRGGLWGGW
jgi:hypothetical protein